MKRKFSLFIFLVLFLLVNNAYSQDSESECIDYVGGIGEFETIFDFISALYKNNFSEIAQGWYVKFPQVSGFKFLPSFDRKNFYSGTASQKIELKKDKNLVVSSSYLHTLVATRKKITSSSPYAMDSKDFYPDIGDKIEFSLYLKTSPILNNLNYQISLLGGYLNSDGSINYLPLVTYGPTSTPLLNWKKIEITSLIPSSPNNRPLYYISARVIFSFPDSSLPSDGVFWLDKASLYIYRNDSCLKWPNKKTKSLKLFEIFSLPDNYDFIGAYQNNNAHLSNAYFDLIIKNHDPEWKYFYYIHFPHKMNWFRPETLSWGNPLSLAGSFFYHFLDDFEFFVNTSSCSSLNNPPIHYNARYPETLRTFSFARYKTDSCTDSSYHNIHAQYDHPFILDKTIEFFKKFLTYFNNEKLKFDAVYFDAAHADERSISRQYISLPEVKKANSFYLRYLKSKTAGLFKTIANFGYSVYTDNNALHLNDAKNYFHFKDDLNGYLDENWLLDRKPINGELRYSLSPQKVHLLFKTIFDNQNFDYILLVSRFLKNYYQDTCNDFSPQTNFVISAFYLVNNPNTYFALVPTGEIDGYNYAQCYTDLLFVPIGKPEKVNRIDDLVIASTSGFTNGALYKRRYEQGLVLLNTSKNLSFNYTLSTTTEPFNSYIQIPAFLSPQSYDFLEFDKTLIIPPSSGLILYNPNPPVRTKIIPVTPPPVLD